jgi:two-component system NtrC family sensor kinase
MARHSVSIRLRLAIGLGLVLAVFSAALLVTLRYLAEVRQMSTEVTARMEVRREALATVRAAQVLQDAFPTEKALDAGDVVRFDYGCERLQERINAVLAGSLDERERACLFDLYQSSIELRVLLDRMARQNAAAPPDDPVGRDLVERSRNALARIQKLNDNLVDASDNRLVAAADKARTAWNYSSAVSKVIFPLALLVSLLVIYYTHRSVVGPVGALVTGTKTLAQGDLGSDIQVDGSGEFMELADSFNRMARTLQVNQKQLIEAEKMASVGRLAAGVAHEINNPLAVIIGHAKMLMDTMGEKEADREQVETIAQEALQCKNIINGLLDLSRPSEATPGEVINPNDVMLEVVNMVQALQLGEGVRIDVSVIDRPIPLTISRPRLRQLGLNIVRNAVEALRGSRQGHVRVEGYIRPRAKLESASVKEASPAASFLILIVTDNGPGIPAQDMSRLFEPFFTTKADGTGLGLAISYNIARAHGGFIEVQSSSSEGTSFTVGLPLDEEGRARQAVDN